MVGVVTVGGRGLNPLRNPMDPLLSCGAPVPFPLDCGDIAGDEALGTLDGPCGCRITVFCPPNDDRGVCRIVKGASRNSIGLISASEPAERPGDDCP